MRAFAFALALVFGWLAEGCSCNGNPAGPDSAYVCVPECTAGTVCRYDACVPTPGTCAQNADCPGDQYCDTSAGECLPWGTGPGGMADPACKREPIPGVFLPGAQCEWVGPPAGDPYPEHKNVLATPMVATFYSDGGEFATPSIVFASYNYTDGGSESCVGSMPASYYGVIRIISGKTCMQQDTIAMPAVIASASVAIADLGGDPTPEIVAARMDGGLVAFTRKPSGWEVMWQTASRFADNMCDWAGPSIHDLDDDGVPEIVFYGAVYDAAGNTLDESRASMVDGTGTGYIPVIADLDGNGAAEMIVGTQIYTWQPGVRQWALGQALPAGNGHVAVADFGTFPQNGQDDRSKLDGVAEIAVVHAGIARVMNSFGREVFSANLQAIGGGAPGKGGPPTIADFDGDGRVEFASAGATAYNVFDLDCRGTPDSATCPSMRIDGIAWIQQSKDQSSNTTGSSVFDFDGDGRAEVVYGDECFTRVYDGKTGKVLYSRFRTSFTWYENPLVVDTDADFNAEIVTTSNTNGNVVCPTVDPIFDGVQCHDDSDCPAASRCGREQAADPLGRCRCAVDQDCGGDGFVCLDPIVGAPSAGRVCRASHPPGAAATGVRVLADSVDRWVNTRTIWNQHAYSVTNIDSSGKVPRTRDWARNWTQPGLNNFRQNTPGDGLPPGAIPDLTVRRAKATCEPSGGATITAQICNRGTEPVAPGLPVAVYADGAPAERRCTGTTTGRLAPGTCTEVSCLWTGGSGDGYVAADDRGDGTGTGTECREDNNLLPVKVDCP
ncbi:MAG TPA: CARDB domain-containing protein [Kofleriaceae bacterium]|nr:CARDB domain-containing protein [Kofleriaceae bacterium]